MFLRELFRIPLEDQKWLTKRQTHLLTKLSLTSVGSLISFFPVRYEDRRKEESIQISLIENRSVVVRVRVMEHSSFYYRSRQHPKILVQDQETRAWLVGFRRFHLKTQLKVGETYWVYARFQYRYNEVQTSFFDIEPVGEGESDLFGKFLPVYGLTERLKQKELRKLIDKAMNAFLDSIEDELPETLRKKRNLIDKSLALKWLHNPEEDIYVKKARVRMAYEELLGIQLIVHYRKARVEHLNVDRSYPLHEKVDSWRNSLPYKLTNAQKRSVEEVFSDMNRSYPMQRLLQGDVGSGKTTVALAALLRAAENGYQSVLMVPTEVLAVQHVRKIRPQLLDLGIKVELLAASTPKDRRIFLLQRLYIGEPLIIVGTHALFQESVVFAKLGLVVIDEQHKFGVRQRIKLTQKAQAPDVLVMTATPIPRTLTLTVYGDLSVSLIDELPANRQTIQTEWMIRDRLDEVYDIVAEELAQGHQSFFVYPLVEESEKLDLKPVEQAYRELTVVFKSYQVRMVYGKMSAEEKESVMQDFADGKIQVLVSTTVIEVGIDVPNATVMVIEHAERFGLSQLHQLRGRVGRGESKSRCILMTAAKVSPDTRFRMQTMVAFQDGFKIAEEDLKLRGPGELLGERQSGMPEPRVADFIRDERLLEVARGDARAIIDYDFELKKPKTQCLVKGLLDSQWLPGYLAGG